MPTKKMQLCMKGFVQCTVYSVECTVYSLQCTVYSSVPQCLAPGGLGAAISGHEGFTPGHYVYFVHCVLYTLVYTPRHSMYFVHCVYFKL